MALGFEFLADDLTGGFGEFLVLDIIEYFFEESVNDQFLSRFLRNASSEHVEDFVILDLARGGSVAAFYIVGFDLQAREGVGLCRIAQQEVSVCLVGIRLLRAVIDFDQS